MQMSQSFNQTQRDLGAAQALENAGETWQQRAEQIAIGFLKAVGHEGALFEEVREYANLLGLPQPPSPNAWGAVALSLSKKKLIEKTGVYEQSKSLKSHARAQPVWRVR